MDVIPHIPREYNAAADLIGRNLQAGRKDKIAYIDDQGTYSFGELARRVDRFASALVRRGVQPETRVFIAMLDTIDWPVAFLGAIKAGAIPVAANTLLKSADYRYMLEDSRARLLFVSDALLPEFPVAKMARGFRPAQLLPDAAVLDQGKCQLIFGTKAFG